LIHTTNSYLPAGAYQEFAFSAIPAGWAYCDGRELSRTVYSELFAAIGIAHGAGNGVTTFNIPDRRDKYGKGWNSSGSRAFGSTEQPTNQTHIHMAVQGAHTHSASQPAHNHGVTDPGHVHPNTVVQSNSFGTGDGSTTFNVPDMRGYFPRGWVDNGSIDSGRSFGSAQTDDFEAHTHTQTTSAVNQYNAGYGFNAGGGSWYSGANPFASGSTGGTETRPYNVAVLACIKY